MIDALLLLSLPLTIYASPNGIDTNLGTSKAPVRSVARAVELARAKHAAVVHLAKGDYPLAKSLALGAANSNLRIEGDGARLLGGKVITGWKSISDRETMKRLTPEARTHVQVVEIKDLDPGMLRYRGFVDGKAASALELFFNSLPMTLARYPNVGKWESLDSVPSPKTFGYAGDRPKQWQTPNDPWVFGYFHFDWADTYDRVVNLDPSKRTVELTREPEYGMAAKRRFYFFNVLEELDSPGEYFVDRRAGKLYFWPPKPGGEVVASLVEQPLVQINNAKNICLSGLNIEAGRNGGVRIDGGSGIRIENCVIRNLGVYGVSINNATKSGVAGCDLTGLGGRGIELIGGDRKTLTAANLYATDNHIWAYSRWPRTYQAGVAIEGVGAKVSHNKIEQAPHNAILLSGNDHTIEYNDIRDVCLETGDSGAIYMGRNLTMRGNQIRFNRFRDIVPTVTTEGNYTAVSSVYLDDQWCGTTIFGNVFEGKGTGIQLGGGRDNMIENNVFLGKDPALHIDQRGKGWAKDKDKEFREQAAELNIDQPPYSRRYRGLKGLFEQDFMLATGNGFVRNIVVGPRPFLFQDGLSEKSLDYRGNEFLKSGDLKAALSAAPKGFKTIPVGQIGLVTKARAIDRR